MTELQTKINSKIFKLLQGDITQQETDAIVNAANERLAPGGGVAGAIHRAAGPMLWRECKKLGGCMTGEAKMTRGYRLKAPYVIHTVGPVYTGAQSDPRYLAECYRNSLWVADENSLESISFPAISTGIFGYPVEEAAEVAIKTILDTIPSLSTVSEVRLVLYSETSLKTHMRVFKEILKQRNFLISEQ